MVRLVHISDLHCGEAPHDRLDRAPDAINSVNADIVVVTGDITRSGRRREYRVAQRFFAALRAPILACPGNHDAPVFDPFARAWTPFERFRKLGLASSWDSGCGMLSVRGLNSACAIQGRLDWSQGLSRREGFAALAATFAKGAQLMLRTSPSAIPGRRRWLMGPQPPWRLRRAVRRVIAARLIGRAAELAQREGTHRRRSCLQRNWRR